MPLTTAAEPGSIDNAGYKLIVFGEDDPDDEELLKEVFAELDASFSLKFINNGRKLLSSLAELPADRLPCLIVLDYNMPELNGAEILQTLQRNEVYHKIPKVVWSTSGSEKYRSLCLSLGAEEYFTKPSSLGELTDLARRILAYC